MAMVHVTPTCSLPDILPALYFEYWKRQQFLKAEVRLHLQIMAMMRLYKPGASQSAEGHRMPDTPLVGALRAQTPWIVADLDRPRQALKKERLACEKKLSALAQQLPVWPWVESVRGFGAVGLGQIVAEANNLAAYDNPAKLWKRFGLAPGQRRSKNKVTAELMGFCPRRRAVMSMVGRSIVMHNQGDYKALYDERKQYETERHPELTKIHIDRRARRYLEKRLLRDLWQEWRSTLVMEPKEGMIATLAEEGR